MEKRETRRVLSLPFFCRDRVIGIDRLGVTARTIPHIRDDAPTSLGANYQRWRRRLKFVGAADRMHARTKRTLSTSDTINRITLARNL